jgi:hypothetical protein
MQHFGHIVREKRGERTLFDVAVAAGVKPQSIGRLEKAGSCQLRIAMKICKALGIQSIPVISD